MTDISVRLQNLIEADPDPAMVEFYTTCLREIDRLRQTIAHLTTEIERKDAVIERLLTSNARYVSEIDRLRAIKNAAIDAASYFHLGGCGEEDFDEQRMGNLMTKLGRALESKP